MISGNAADPEVLRAANLAGRALPAGRHPGCLRGRAGGRAGARAQPALPILARAHSEAEIAHLKKHGAPGRHGRARDRQGDDRGHPARLTPPAGRIDTIASLRCASINGKFSPLARLVVAGGVYNHSIREGIRAQWVSSISSVSRSCSAPCWRSPGSCRLRRAAVRGAVAAGLSRDRHAGGRSGAARHQVRRCEAAYTVGSVALALILFDGGLRTRFQTFRNVIGPGGPAGHDRGPRDRRADRAGGGLYARVRLDRGAADGRGHCVHRRRRRVLPAARRGPAVTAAGERDARSRIRHQRPVRDLPHHHPGGNSAVGAQALDRNRRSPGAGRR